MKKLILFNIKNTYGHQAQDPFQHFCRLCDFRFRFRELNVVLVKRDYKDPVSGEIIIHNFSLAGYHINEGEDFDKAAYRILRIVQV